MDIKAGFTSPNVPAVYCRIIKTEILNKKTTPPQEYSIDTLLSFMENPRNEDGAKLAGLGTPATRAEIIKKLVTQQYMELAAMLGRMHQAEREFEDEFFADTVIKPDWKADHASKADLIGIHESDDLSSMLPSEAAFLSDETTNLLFYKKFTEKKLQTFEYQLRHVPGGKSLRTVYHLR